MNFVAHAAVSSVAGLDPMATFMSMTPDLIGLAREAPPELGPAGQRGLAAHRITDRLFHSDKQFLAWQQLLRDVLPAADHATVAALHVATELYIDGALLHQGHHASAYHDSLNAVREVLPPPWKEVVRALLEDNEPTRHYDNVSSIAARSATLVTNRLKRHVEAADVARALDSVCQEIASAVDSLIDQLAAALTTELATARNRLSAQRV